MPEERGQKLVPAAALEAIRLGSTSRAVGPGLNQFGLTIRPDGEQPERRPNRNQGRPDQKSRRRKYERFTRESGSERLVEVRYRVRERARGKLKTGKKE
jgi:hypothetical protein